MSSRSGVSPAARQDGRAFVLFLAALASLLAVAAVLMASVAAATVLAGGRWQLPDPATWGSRLRALFTHLADPGRAFGAPWAVLAGHPVVYWTVTAVLEVAAAVVLVVVGRSWWRRFGPVEAGHATRPEIRAELSVEVAREIGARTRPMLAAAELRGAALEEVGSPLHTGAIGRLCVPFENPTGNVAPTQSGKSRRAFVHIILAAPGALLCSTTKPDLFEFTALARTRCPLAGPVLVFDTTGAVVWPAVLRWSPVQGCHDPRVAEQRAKTMVGAAAVSIEAGDGGGAGNDRVFRDRAVVVLTAYLLAAALHRKSVHSLVQWATSTRAGLQPLELLQDRFPDVAANLRKEIEMVPETSDAVWMSVRRVVNPLLLDERLAQLCSPPPGEGFDARAFIANQGSLYLIAEENDPAAPLLTALADYVLTTAREMSVDFPTKRHDPPVSVVLDEVTNATPIPTLPNNVSDSAGRGVIIHWAAQSLAQLDAAFGTNGARLLLDTTTTLSIWGGLKDKKTLEWASELFGHYDRTQYQTHSDGFMSPARTTVGTQTVPVYRPGDIRMLPRNEVLIAHRQLPAVRARTTDVTRRRDWKQLHADVAAIRAGTPEVDDAGYSTLPGFGPHDGNGTTR